MAVRTANQAHNSSTQQGNNMSLQYCHTAFLEKCCTCLVVVVELQLCLKLKGGSARYHSGLMCLSNVRCIPKLNFLQHGRPRVISRNFAADAGIMTRKADEKAFGNVLMCHCPSAEDTRDWWTAWSFFQRHMYVNIPLTEV